MSTLTPDLLAQLLRQRAAGSYAVEAATELLIAHGTWLRRGDFVYACVNYDHDGTHPVAWIDWDAVVPWFLDGTACSSSALAMKVGGSASTMAGRRPVFIGACRSLYGSVA
jgi:hypothetical protein